LTRFRWGEFMGIMWVVWPLDGDMTSYLDSQEIDYPEVPSRFPTGREIQEALQHLNGYDVEINDNGLSATWQAMITQSGEVAEPEWALLNISCHSGDDQPQKLIFEKGYEELIKKVLRLLVPRCGPLVLIDDAGGEPQVILA